MSTERVVLEEAVGLETSGNTHTAVFVRGLHLPAHWTKTFRTAEDEQRQMVIHVLQGNSTAAEECRQVGQFTVEDLPVGARNQVSLQVTISIDECGRLSLCARGPRGRSLAVSGNILDLRTQGLADFTGLGGQWGSW